MSASHSILPGAVHWIRAGAPTAVRTLPLLYGTTAGNGTYTVDAHPNIVFYDVNTWLTEPPTSPAAILAAAGRPRADYIILCATRRVDRCGCGGYKPADTTECVYCFIKRADREEGEEGIQPVAHAEEEEGIPPVAAADSDDDDDFGVCANCFRGFYGDGFHGFCGPTCAAAKHGTVCHCCYE